MQVMSYFFIPDEDAWYGFPKDCSDYQVRGKSFEELQAKLHQPHLDTSQSASCFVCSNTALLSWYWERKTFRIPPMRGATHGRRSLHKTQFG